jgi:hypothetical protein
MGEITIVFLLLAVGLSVGLVRAVRNRARIDTRTREWIEYLQEDLSASSL